MDYPYINLDLLKYYVVYFHGDIDKWANTMQYAVESYDGEQHLLCNVTWDNDYYTIREIGSWLIAMYQISNLAEYQILNNVLPPVITIEELIKMSSSSDDYDFSNELQTLLDN